MTCWECRRELAPGDRVVSWLEETHDKGHEEVFAHLDCDAAERATAALMVAALLLPVLRGLARRPVMIVETEARVA